MFIVKNGELEKKGLETRLWKKLQGIYAVPCNTEITFFMAKMKQTICFIFVLTQNMKKANFSKEECAKL